MSHALAAAASTAAATAHAKAGVLVRQARVELYCDHPASALAAIRRAVCELELPLDALDAEEIVTLERAAWHVRRRETSAAASALELAIRRLDA